ncbi:MAG: ATP-binding protein [Ottowia sp.]|nr:ATP-binding protein [Ottowia sp.]
MIMRPCCTSSSRPRPAQARCAPWPTRCALARFPSHRDLAGFDFAHTQLDEALVRQPHTLRFVESAHNVVLVGGPGRKTHLATSLGIEAIRMQYVASGAFLLHK